MPINRIRLDDVDIRNITATTSVLNSTLGQLEQTVIANNASTTSEIAKIKSDIIAANARIDQKANSVSPVLTGSVSAGDSLITNEIIEKMQILSDAVTGTLNIDFSTSATYYYTNNASANWTFNFRGSASSTLNTVLDGSQMATITILITNGGTAYRPTGFQIDGTNITVKWADGIAPSSGNINSIDAYTFTIIKISANTYTVLGSQSRFA